MPYESIGHVRLYRVFRGIFFPIPASTYERFEAESHPKPSLLQRIYRIYLSTVFAIYSGLFCAAIAKKYTIDVIIERETSFGAGAICSLLSRRPLVLEINGPVFSKLSSNVARLAMSYTESLAGHSVDPRKVRLMNVGVDLRQFRPDAEEGSATRRTLGLSRHAVVGYVGTFQPWHGVDVLVKASQIILRKIRNVRFLLVGPYFSGIKRMVEKLGLLPAYVFTGPVQYEQVMRYLNSMDIVVAPSRPMGWTRKRGLPAQTKIFEYMACGKPVIASNLEPTNRVIQHGVDGLLVPSGDPRELARAIIMLLDNPILAAELGWRARLKAENDHSWRLRALEVEGVLTEAVNQWQASTA